MSEAQLAQGCTITFGATPVIEVTNITNLGPENSDVDVTSHSSADRTREFIPGLIDPGEVSMDVNFAEQDAGQQELFDNANAAALDIDTAIQELSITLPPPLDSEGPFLVNAYVKSFKLGLPSDGGPQSGTIVFRTTGPVTPPWGS
jgi:hypothetical protein